MVAELDAKMDTLQISMQFLQESRRRLKGDKTQDKPAATPEQFNVGSPARPQRAENQTETLRPPTQPGQTMGQDPMIADDAWAWAQTLPQTIGRSPLLTQLRGVKGEAPTTPANPLAAANAGKLWKRQP